MIITSHHCQFHYHYHQWPVTCKELHEPTILKVSYIYLNEKVAKYIGVLKLPAGVTHTVLRLGGFIDTDVKESNIWSTAGSLEPRSVITNK